MPRDSATRLHPDNAGVWINTALSEREHGTTMITCRNVVREKKGSRGGQERPSLLDEMEDPFDVDEID